MKKTEVVTLFDYNYWANTRVMEAAERVGEGSFAAPADLSHGSLRDTLVHIYGAEQTWRMRCQEGLSPASLPRGEAFPTLAALSAEWQQEELTMRSFLGSLSDDDLGRTVEYKNTKGTSFANPMWQLLLHLVNHGTQFRGEAAVLLTRLGASPGDLDFIYYLRQLA